MFVEIQGWWDTHESLCIAMEYFPYGTLKDCLSEIGERDAKSILRQVLQGLCHMHASEFVHRDLKPEVSAAIYNCDSFVDCLRFCKEHFRVVQSRQLESQDRRFRTD